MDCPKCGHQQADTVKCESCGIYFAKLQRAAPATGATSGGVSYSPPAGPGIGVGALVVMAPVTAAGVYGLMRGHGPTESAYIANYQPAIVSAPLGVGKIIDRTKRVVFLAAVMVAMPDDPGSGAGAKAEKGAAGNLHPVRFTSNGQPVPY